MKKILDILTTITLFTALAIGLYLLWLNLPAKPIEFEDYHSNISKEFPVQSSQFYRNMRYPTETITYGFSSRCGKNQGTKKQDVKKAVVRLEKETILKFKQDNRNPEITITCSKIAPEPEQEGHFVAGEGGPTTIINASRYSVIKTGKISLFRADKCKKPQIATHEILHALGFDHNSNPESIMYPVTECNQEIDESIIREIERLYSQKPYGDLLIDKVEAEKRGAYLNFEIVIANFGLKEIGRSNLVLAAENSEIKNFDIGVLDIGSKKTLTIKNLRIPRSTKKIIFTIKTDEKEISKNNNEASLKTPKKE